MSSVSGPSLSVVASRASASTAVSIPSSPEASALPRFCPPRRPRRRRFRFGRSSDSSSAGCAGLSVAAVLSWVDSSSASASEPGRSWRLLRDRLRPPRDRRWRLSPSLAVSVFSAGASATTAFSDAGCSAVAGAGANRLLQTRDNTPGLVPSDLATGAASATGWISGLAGAGSGSLASGAGAVGVTPRTRGWGADGAALSSSRMATGSGASISTS